MRVESAVGRTPLQRSRSSFRTLPLGSGAMIFPAGRGSHRTRFQRLRSWRPHRSSSNRSATTLGIAHHQGMVDALRAATAPDLHSQ